MPAQDMARTDQPMQPLELDCADVSVTQEMTRWLSHLRAERRLSPKTLEAYARDLRQCLIFLGEHWGRQVTLKGFAGAVTSATFSLQYDRIAAGSQDGSAKIWFSDNTDFEAARTASTSR